MVSFDACDAGSLVICICQSAAGGFCSGDTEAKVAISNEVFFYIAMVLIAISNAMVYVMAKVL